MKQASDIVNFHYLQKNFVKTEPELKENIKTLESKISILEHSKQFLLEKGEQATNLIETIQKLNENKDNLENQLNDGNTVKTLDFGPNNQFSGLYGLSAESSKGSFVYTVKFFDSAIQRDNGPQYSLG